MTTGERIKAARKEAGMTQGELAARLNIPAQSVSQWERDLRNPKVETLKKIAVALGVTVSELTGYTKHWADFFTVEEFEEEAKREEDERNYKLLTKHYYRLNDAGKAEAVKRVEELTEIPKYKQSTD